MVKANHIQKMQKTLKNYFAVQKIRIKIRRWLDSQKYDSKTFQLESVNPTLQINSLYVKSEVCRHSKFAIGAYPSVIECSDSVKHQLRLQLKV